MKRLLDVSPEDLLAFSSVSDHGVVVERHALPAKSPLIDLRPFLHLVAVNDPVGFSEELEDGKQLTVRVFVPLDRLINAGAEHLPQIRAWNPARWDVVTIRLGAELRIERQRDLCDVNHV